MAPRLRVLVSSPGSIYPPTKPLTVNSPIPTPLKTDSFDGEISVWVKNFEGDHKGGEGDEYFSIRPGMTYAIVLRGKFTEDLDGDEVMWGNVFQKPIRDSLPWGTAIATKFMYFAEPTIESDIYADIPYALSTLMASMNYLAFDKDDKSSPAIEEHVEVDDLQGGDGKARKKYFTDKVHRKAFNLKDKPLAMEFSNGLIDFNTLSINFPPPFSLQIPLTRYWDGQPATYVCQKRGRPGKDVLFSVAFEIVDEEMKKALKDRGGASASGDEEEVEGDQKISDDLD